MVDAKTSWNLFKIESTQTDNDDEKKCCIQQLVHSQKNEFKVLKPLVQHFTRNSILKQEKMAAQCYMLQFLKNLNLNTILVPGKVR